MKDNIYDCILIHTPKFNHYFHPLGKVGFINIIPSGLFSMANLLNTNGIKTKIIHIGLEKVVHKNISIEEIIKRNKAKVYGISLMWNHQAYECIELARQIKKIYPDSIILFGGLTASIYAEEIINLFGFIDGVIRGEGEIPLLLFMQKYLRGNNNFSDIPNLIYKIDNNVILNKDYITASQSEFDKFRFTDISTLDHYKEYGELKYVYKYDHPNLMRLLNALSLWISPIYYIVLGRGCPYNCSFCAGGYNLRYILKKDKPITKSIDSILVDVENFYRLGIKSFTSAFYYKHEQENIAKAIKEISKHFNGVSINQDIWHDVPSNDFIDSFQHLNTRSTILLLVYSLSEYQRHLNSIGSYSNERIINAIKYAKRQKVRMRIILSSGLPFENRETVKETKSMIKTIKKINSNILAYSYPTELAPNSPMHLKPDRFNVIHKLNRFIDFYELHKSDRYSIGYHFIDRDEREILLHKCRNECLINPLGGRYICNILHFATKKLL